MKNKWLRYLGLTIVFLWFLLGGIGHFTMTDFFVRIVPPYVPAPLAVVYVTGVLEIAGAIGVLIPRFRRVAGMALFALTICVTPANVYMWQHPELFPNISVAALTLRLPLQLLLLACIWWSTQSKNPP